MSLPNHPPISEIEFIPDSYMSVKYCVTYLCEDNNFIEAERDTSTSYRVYVDDEEEIIYRDDTMICTVLCNPYGNRIYIYTNILPVVIPVRPEDVMRLIALNDF